MGQRADRRGRAHNRPDPGAVDGLAAGPERHQETGIRPGDQCRGIQVGAFAFGCDQQRVCSLSGVGLRESGEAREQGQQRRAPPVVAAAAAFTQMIHMRGRVDGHRSHPGAQAEQLR